ncbi:SpoIIE family protein phosphatase [Pullulanibacillus sp. KACC 23026]|uniref:SpoIIE family protein phosphatase n=1 Tax=Pullulanibacillus sp. KACC 23026 TaxID=3028315 RepID=UPI0023AFD1F0|nr:SpoIIE family protein phosphatase [Pullulanibacillus sp. KACC 23026]WEG12520.1 SpoIIE family protein phosphatase [Pullulanibacillus sp. KACC 23026]
MIEQFTFESYIFSVFQKPKNDHMACGDSYWLKETDETMIGVIADGLGSGPAAQKASKAAIETVKRLQDQPIKRIILEVNKDQSNYRGVVLSIIKYYKKTRKLEYCGVGNIRLKLVMSMTQVIQPRSKNGFLSGRPIDLEVHELIVEPNAWLIMYSDGIDFHQRELFDLYELFNSCTDEQINTYFSSSDHAPLVNHDDLTILIGKPH